MAEPNLLTKLPPHIFQIVTLMVNAEDLVALEKSEILGDNDINEFSLLIQECFENMTHFRMFVIYSEGEENMSKDDIATKYISTLFRCGKNLKSFGFRLPDGERLSHKFANTSVLGAIFAVHFPNLTGFDKEVWLDSPNFVEAYINKLVSECKLTELMCSEILVSTLKMKPNLRKLITVDINDEWTDEALNDVISTRILVPLMST